MVFIKRIFISKIIISNFTNSVKSINYQIITEIDKKVEYLNFYLLYEPNRLLCAFTTTHELQFHIFDSRDKIVQNIKFLPISQNSDLISKLDLNNQHESRGMLSFQNRVPDIKLLKFHVNRDNQTYLKKCNFLRKLICQI